MVTAMQENNSFQKGCVLFVVHISNDKCKDVKDDEALNKYLVLQQF